MDCSEFVGGGGEMEQETDQQSYLRLGGYLSGSWVCLPAGALATVAS